MLHDSSRVAQGLRAFPLFNRLQEPQLNDERCNSLSPDAELNDEL